MYSADSGGLHTHVEIEQHLALEMPLERKLGNRNQVIVVF